VKELTHGALNMAGQICVAAARFLVHDPIAKDLRSTDHRRLPPRPHRPRRDPASQMGSLIDREPDARQGLIEQAGDEGEMILRAARNTGAFLTPTLFRIDDVTSPLVQEELFGPIVSIETFEDEAEAVAKANATPYGLAASVFTRDLARAMRVSRAIRSGTVWLNCHLRLFAEARPAATASRASAACTAPRG
jgi:betaine-aldehyde dehydrogenase